MLLPTGDGRLTDPRQSRELRLGHLKDGSADVANRAHSDALYAQTELSQADQYASAHFSFMRVADIRGFMSPNDMIRRILADKRLTQQEVGERLGVSQSTVTRWKAGSEPEGHRRDAIISLYEAIYDSTPPASTGSMPTQVRVVGKGGAGPFGEVVFDGPEQTLGMVPAPLNATDTTVAIEVQGDSMRGIANDGWLVFYDDHGQPPTSELYGELCVVGLEDGRTLVKFLERGRNPGLFDLESMNASTMRDVPVRWASLVTNIVPRRAARKMMRADPTIGVNTAKAV